MNYFESRRRHEFIDELQQVTADTLSNPKLGRHLSQAEIEPLKYANDLLFVPNIRRGKVVMPKNPGEAIPIIAINHGEEIEISGATHDYTPQQKDRILTRYPELREEAFYEDIFNSSRSEHATTLKPRASALVTSLTRFLPAYDIQGNETGVYLNGRPMVLITPNKDFLAKKREVLPHELTHVLQKLRGAEVGEASGLNISHELEAYRIASAVIKASKLHRADGGKLDHEATNAQRLEAIRRKYNNPSDPYAVTKALVDEIKKAGLFGLVELKVSR